MKKSVKKLLCSLLVAIMCLSSVPLGGLVGVDFGKLFSVKASAEVFYFLCNNYYYTFDSDTGVLTIDGEGDMEDFDGSKSHFCKSPYFDVNLIKTIVIKEGATSIGRFAFYKCSSLESVVIPNSVTSIGAFAFAGCYNLTDITIPDSVTSIGQCAFATCTDLKNVAIPEGVSTIEYGTFLSCSSLESITIPDSVTSIEMEAFNGCGSLKNVIIPDSVTNIGQGAFCLCVSLENVTLSKKIESINESTFMLCASLKSVNIPEGVKTIGEDAFISCASLEEITMPKTVETINDLAFSACTSLKSVDIPESVTYIGRGIFAECCSLEKITVDVNNSNYMSDNDVLFNKDRTELIQYPCGSKNERYVVPASVKSICSYAFCGALFVDEIELPDTLESCGDYAFAACLSLTEMTLQENIANIGSSIFSDCYYLDKVYIKSMTAEFEASIVNKNGYDTSKISKDDFATLCYKERTELVIYEDSSANYKHFTVDISPEIQEELDKYSLSERVYTTTLYCHSGSTAEAYAVENGVPYVLTHFFEGDWIYDYDKMIRYRKCIHCDEIESEPLETTEDNDTEIIAPTDPDKDFTVDKVEPDSSKYIVVEDAFKHHGPEHWYIVKAFDINMTDKNGVHVQPDGMVRVMLPFDSSKHGVYKVYRVNDDGTLTDMHAFRQGNSLVFDTDHFSLYVVVDESETPDTGSDTPSGGEKTDFISKLFAFITKIIEMITGWFKK